jgi:hypothetical protein
MTSITDIYLYIISLQSSDICIKLADSGKTAVVIYITLDISFDRYLMINEQSLHLNLWEELDII